MDVPRPQRRRRLARAGLLVAIAAGAVTTAAFGFVRASNTTASVSRRDVRVETVRRGPLVREVQARGTLVPDQVQWVTAAGPARVARIDVAPGASVTAGHSLVVLENAELELAALDAERAASSARADVAALLGRSQVELLESDATRAAMETELSALQSRAQTTAALAREGLAPAADARELDVRTRGARTRVDMERSRRALVDRGARDELAARTEAVKKMDDVARFRRDQLRALAISAPTEGIVQEMPLEPGQWVTAGTVLAKIAKPGRLKAILEVPEALAAEVVKGEVVHLTLPSSAVEGVVTRVDPHVERGAVRVEVGIADPMPPGARFDLAVTGTIEIERVEDSLVVARPPGAAAGAAEVFILERDGTAKKRVVHFGRGSVHQLEVLDGAEEGEGLLFGDLERFAAFQSIRVTD